MRSRAWAAFWALGIIWGASFLLIRIGVEQLNPFELVFFRVTIAALGLNLVLRLRGKSYPRDTKTIRALILIGLGNTAIPFLLITWGEKSVPSGLASVLQASVPLFSLVMAHFSFDDERMTPARIGGLITGFFGVIVLASRSFGVEQTVNSPTIEGQIAIVIASVFYAYFAIFSRKTLKGNIEPMVVSAGAMTSASVTMGFVTYLSPLLGGPAPTALATLRSDVVIAMLVLGFLNTLIAYMMFYYVIQELGASRSTMITYVVPLIGLTLGTLLLNEPTDARLILGALLIAAGIAIVNFHIFQRPKPLPEAVSLSVE